MNTTDAINEDAAQTLTQRVLVRLGLEDVVGRLKDIVSKMNTAEPKMGMPVARKVINCPDETMTASENGHIQSVKFAIPKDTRDIIIAAILALSILVNVAMYMKLNSLQQTVDLDRYDDNTFINGRFAELSAQVKADHDLIQAYGLQKAVKER
jgi:hypothetical protein